MLRKRYVIFVRNEEYWLCCGIFFWRRSCRSCLWCAAKEAEISSPFCLPEQRFTLQRWFMCLPTVHTLPLFARKWVAWLLSTQFAFDIQSAVFNWFEYFRPFKCAVNCSTIYNRTSEWRSAVCFNISMQHFLQAISVTSAQFVVFCWPHFCIPAKKETN